MISYDFSWCYPTLPDLYTKANEPHLAWQVLTLGSSWAANLSSTPREKAPLNPVRGRLAKYV